MVQTQFIEDIQAEDHEKSCDQIVCSMESRNVTIIYVYYMFVCVYHCVAMRVSKNV